MTCGYQEERIESQQESGRYEDLAVEKSDHPGGGTKGKGHLPFYHISAIIQLFKANDINLELEKKSKVEERKLFYSRC